jgi:hypothetical protein
MQKRCLLELGLCPEALHQRRRRQAAGAAQAFEGERVGAMLMQQPRGGDQNLFVGQGFAAGHLDLYL